MFCTPDDFNLIPYNIPNVSSVVNTLQPYIDKHEEEVLKKALGVPLYNEFISARALLPSQWVVTTAYLVGQQVVDGISIWEAVADNTGIPPVEGTEWTKIEDNKWLMLEKGSPFVYDDDWADEWLGLVDMLVPYIFSNWLRDTFDNHSGIGVVQPKAENAEVISPSLRIVRAYNEFVEKADTLGWFISEANSDADPNADPPIPPAYANWTFWYPNSINTFGI